MVPSSQLSVRTLQPPNRLLGVARVFGLLRPTNSAQPAVVKGCRTVAARADSLAASLLHEDTNPMSQADPRSQMAETQPATGRRPNARGASLAHTIVIPALDSAALGVASEQDILCTADDGQGHLGIHSVSDILKGDDSGMVRLGMWNRLGCLHLLLVLARGRGRGRWICSLDTGPACPNQEMRKVWRGMQPVVPSRQDRRRMWLNGPVARVTWKIRNKQKGDFGQCLQQVVKLERRTSSQRERRRSSGRENAQEMDNGRDLSALAGTSRNKEGSCRVLVAGSLSKTKVSIRASELLGLPTGWNNGFVFCISTGI
ncbi:hypothetical protein B0T20DRAFT_392414 [Sordaria brevicollis]|uniref:Uncharacterized protein n=1 Tax=Sordaria brevicollis TaxID=83679 RepID=A0AAE0PG93_SORBR|nr:hypothetical protein B0T20DRAFT_392414 [Sordaria brevicollis]